MPIFEYKCSSCGGDFELLVRGGTELSCPECGSARIDKKFSVFASHVHQGVQDAPACHTGMGGCDLGRCGSGLCGVD
jgi:putative FmdB family regulatory protein